jgi:transposase
MPSKAEVVRTYVRRGLSLRQAAAELGCSKDTAARVLQAYGLERRPRVRPKLQKSDLAAIMNERRPDIWTTRPWREIAAKYGVSVKTLERFIAAAKARGVTPRTLKDIARREWKWLLRK